MPFKLLIAQYTGIFQIISLQKELGTLEEILDAGQINYLKKCTGKDNWRLKRIFSRYLALKWSKKKSIYSCGTTPFFSMGGKIGFSYCGDTVFILFTDQADENSKFGVDAEKNFNSVKTREISSFLNANNIFHENFSYEKGTDLARIWTLYEALIKAGIFGEELLRVYPKILEKEKIINNIHQYNYKNITCISFYLFFHWISIAFNSNFFPEIEITHII